MLISYSAYEEMAECLQCGNTITVWQQSRLRRHAIRKTRARAEREAASRLVASAPR
jgi:hypothetical protein